MRDPLRMLIAALRDDGDPETAAGVAAFAQLAAATVLLHGVRVLPLDQDGDVERLADRHFGLKRARVELHAALRTVDAREAFDAIDAAVTHVRQCSDDAHYWLGLATGLVLAACGGADGAEALGGRRNGQQRPAGKGSRRVARTAGRGGERGGQGN